MDAERSRPPARGYVEFLTLDCGTWQLTCACVGEDDSAFYGYPGDVVYPKSGWRLVGRRGRRTLREHEEIEAAAFERAWAQRGGA